MSSMSLDCSFKDLIQSDLFTFYIGDEKKPFVVHSKAIAATSEHFRALVNGDMIESKTRSAEIQDVDPSDFARYLEYAYRRDYTAPSWIEDDNLVKNEVPSPPEPGSRPEPKVVEERFDHSFLFKRNEGARAKLRSRFERRIYLPAGELTKHSVPQTNSAVDQDYTPVFLAHARLYTLANMRLVEPLKRLVLHKLHRTLKGFKLYKERVVDVIALVRYAYDNGKDRYHRTIDDLRNLVVEYIAYEVDTFGWHKEFVHLLEEGGEFVSDFWRLVSGVSLLG